MDNVANINSVLKSFKISAECKNFQELKNSYFYDLELKPGEKLNKLFRCSAEISLALKYPSKPIFEILSDKGIIRCEFLKKREDQISLFSLGNNSIRPTGEITCLLGEATNGNPIWMDITKNPHLLIAGTSGSGKSTILHSIIANIFLYPNIQLFLIDPKNSEFFKYKDVKNTKSLSFSYNEAISTLEYLSKEMEDRYLKLKEGYGGKFPYMILIIDELADLSLQDVGGKFYNLLCRIAQKSRAVGIYLICATQRPSVNIINGAIKANFSARISCKVATGVDSRVILDAMGAESLMGSGDAIINTSQFNMKRFQAAFTTTEQILNYFKVN